MVHTRYVRQTKINLFIMIKMWLSIDKT